MHTKSLVVVQLHQILVQVHVQQLVQDLQLNEVRLLLVLRQEVQADVRLVLLVVEAITEVTVVLVQAGLLLEAEVGLLLVAVEAITAAEVAVQVGHLLVVQAEAVLLEAAEVVVQALLVVDEVTKKLIWFSEL